MAASFAQDGVKSYRKVTVEHLAGDVFSAHPESSNRETLWSELFQEKERAAMRRHLISRMVAFSVRDTYQISVRMLWTKEALGATQSWTDATSVDQAIKGPVALMCHDFGGRLTSSWTWAKLAYPLHKAGISVVMVDFPGFGLSKVGGRAEVDRAAWIERDWRIVVQLMDVLKIRKCHLITCGESCNLVLKMLRFVKLRLELTHVFFNPVMDLDALFPDEATRRGGLGPKGLKKLRSEQRNSFELLLHNSKVKIWALFDQSTQSTQQTNTILSSFAGLAFASDQVAVTQLGEEHICAASAGSAVQVPMLFPCRYLKHGFVRFLKCESTFAPPQSLLSEQLGACVAEELRGGPSVAPGSNAAWAVPNLATPANALSVALDVCSQSPAARQSAMLTLARASTPGGRAVAPRRTASTPTRVMSASGTSRSTMRNGKPVGGGGGGGGDGTLSSGGCRGFVIGSSNLSSSDRPTDIKNATKLALQMQRADVYRERDILLTNTPSVTKLKNWTELRGGDARRTSDIDPQEAAALEDALDMSMQTLEADEQRRRLVRDDRCNTRKRRNDKLMEKLRALNIGSEGNEGLIAVPRYTGGVMGGD